MKAKELFQALISKDPNQFPHLEACLNYVLARPGAGFHWNQETGEVDPDNPEKFLQNLPEGPEDLEDRLQDYYARSRKAGALLEKFPIDEVTSSSLALTFPRKMAYDWSEAMMNLWTFVCSTQEEAYETYRSLSHKAYLENTAEQLEEELAEYQKSGIISSWLMMEVTLKKSNFEWFDRYGEEFFEGDPNRYRKSTLQESLLSSFREEYDYEPTYPSMREFSRRKWLENPCSKVQEDLDKVTQATKDFEEKVWNPWLQDYYHKSSMRGHSSEVGGVKMLVGGSAGRVLVTFRDPQIPWNPPNKRGLEYDRYLTIIGSDSQPGMGLQGLHMPAQKAISLIQETIANSDLVRTSIQVDKEVGL